MGYFTLKEKNITLKPEKRVYNQPQQLTTEAAIYSNFWSDIYLVIGDGPDNDGNYTVRAFFEPFIPFLWYGILMMGVGGILALTDKNLRITSRRSKQI
jgi:cytochrome c-type biogenesis protein CcmF